jgi:hypothetical protein
MDAGFLDLAVQLYFAGTVFVTGVAVTRINMLISPF